MIQVLLYLFFRYDSETLSKAGKLAIILSEVEVVCSGKKVRKKIGRPLKILPNGRLMQPETGFFHSRSQPLPGETFTQVLKSPPMNSIPASSGVTPELAKVNLNSGHEQNSIGRQLFPESEIVDDEESISLFDTNVELGTSIKSEIIIWFS